MLTSYFAKYSGLVTQFLYVRGGFIDHLVLSLTSEDNVYAGFRIPKGESSETLLYH